MNKQASNPQQVQASLRKSVANALERKRRLGQYAVVWRDGRAVRIEPEETRCRVEDTDGPVVYREGDEHNTTKHATQ